MAWHGGGCDPGRPYRRAGGCYFGAKDKAAAIHETNIAGQLAADADIRGDLYDRVKALELEIKEMQKEQLSQARRDATLTLENEHKTKEIERQDMEIKDLRKRLRESEAVAAELRRELDAVKLLVAQHHSDSSITIDKNEPIEVKLVEDDKTESVGEATSP